MSSDGPKNSQGFIRNLNQAGMTGSQYHEQLLGYTGGEWTERIASAWIYNSTEEQIRKKSLDPSCPRLLLTQINKYLHWLDKKRNSSHKMKITDPPSAGSPSEMAEEAVNEHRYAAWTKFLSQSKREWADANPGVRCPWMIPRNIGDPDPWLDKTYELFLSQYSPPEITGNP
jgi:hypothetical protein